jgi:hypothetical protein
MLNFSLLLHSNAQFHSHFQNISTTFSEIVQKPSTIGMMISDYLPLTLIAKKIGECIFYNHEENLVLPFSGEFDQKLKI